MVRRRVLPSILDCYIVPPIQLFLLNNACGLSSVLGIYSILSNQNINKTKADFGGKNFSLFKDQLTELLIDKIIPIGKKIKDLLKDEKYLDEILNKGAEKADKLASKKIEEMKTIVGF